MSECNNIVHPAESSLMQLNLHAGVEIEMHPFATVCISAEAVCSIQFHLWRVRCCIVITETLCDVDIFNYLYDLTVFKKLGNNYWLIQIYI